VAAGAAGRDGSGSGCINSQGGWPGLGLGGHVEKCALSVAFDRVAYAYGLFSLKRPRLPASGDGFNPRT